MQKKNALDSGMKTNRILTNDDEVFIPSLFNILLAVLFGGKLMSIGP